MHSMFRKVSTYLSLVSFVLIWGHVSSPEAGPIFESISDTAVCEGDELVLIIYADADMPGDVLDFEIEDAPEGAVFAEIGPCG